MLEIAHQRCLLGYSLGSSNAP